VGKHNVNSDRYAKYNYITAYPDGFAGGPNGEMDWIRLDDEMFDLVGAFTEESDTAIYGRITWQMMDNYWPTAANQPNATKHDREHSAWYNRVKKIVLSKSYHGLTTDKTTFLGDNVIEEITKLKEEPVKISSYSVSVCRTYPDGTRSY
jgi:dihydrofolate reductase